MGRDEVPAQDVVVEVPQDFLSISAVRREKDQVKRQGWARSWSHLPGTQAGPTPAIDRDISEPVFVVQGWGQRAPLSSLPQAPGRQGLSIHGPPAPPGGVDKEEKGQEERGYLLDHTLLIHDVGLEAQHSKHHEGGQHRGEEVDEGHQSGVKVAVVVLLVVAGEGDDAPKAQPQGEEDLRGCVPPHLRVQHLVQLCGTMAGEEKRHTVTVSCQRSGVPTTPPFLSLNGVQREPGVAGRSCGCVIQGIALNRSEPRIPHA